MSSGDDSGDPRSATPTDQPGQALDAGTAKPDTAAAVPAGSTPPPSSEPATATPAANGAPAAKPATPVPDDPVRAAIARLARDGGSAQPRDDQGRFTAAERAAAEIARRAGKPVTPAKPATPAAAAPAAAKPAAETAISTPGVDTDPYHGFDERERAALNGRTRARIEELNQRWRTAEAERTKLAAAGSQPDEFTELIQQHKLENDVGFVPADHLAGLMRAQAAIVRSQIAVQQGRNPAAGDVQAASKFFDAIDAVRGQLGLNKPAPTAAEILPFKGDLPADAKDLVEVYGLPEADVRMLVALKARQAAAAVGGGSPTRPVPQAPPMPPAQQRGEGVDMDALYGQRFVADLTREGVQPAMVKAHFQVLLPIAASITQQRFPGLPVERVAAVFDALPPQERYNILNEAQKVYRAKSTPVRPSTPPPPASQPGLNGSAPRRVAPAANGDPVAAAVAFLARPG